MLSLKEVANIFTGQILHGLLLYYYGGFFFSQDFLHLQSCEKWTILQILFPTADMQVSWHWDVNKQHKETIPWLPCHHKNASNPSTDKEVI